MTNTVTVGNWDPELREYTNLQQIPWIRVGDELPAPGTLVYVSEYGIHTISQDGRQLVPIEDAEVAPEEPQQVTNQEEPAMNSHDSISRSALLSMLRSKSMTQEEMIELVRRAAPLEVDSIHNSYVTTPSIHIEGCRGGYGYGYVPDHMG